DVLVRTRVIGGPRKLSRVLIDRLEPAAHAELAAAHTDEDFSFHNQRRHRHRLAKVDVRELRVPELFAGGSIERDGTSVECVEDHFAAVDDETAIDDVAACDTL